RARRGAVGGPRPGAAPGRLSRPGHCARPALERALHRRARRRDRRGAALCPGGLTVADPRPPLPLRFAVVGAGAVARDYVRALADVPEIRLVAAVDVDE